MMETTGEKKYTLAEAKQMLERQECAVQGHDLSFLMDGGCDLTGAYCARCGDRWSMEKI